MHSGKQHGLNDCIDQILEKKPALVILPDAGTNDSKECEKLANAAIQSIVLDHHDKEQDNPYAIIINNQIGNYSNKQLSGAGVTWHFCRYIDKIIDINYAERYIDLAALGNLADMMSLRNFETKRIIEKGFQNVHNPFITYLAEKNKYSLKDKLTPMGAAFYIAPFVNAIVRSGTQEEKELTFKSMLSFHAFDIIPSTKRGHVDGDTETIVEQVMRIVTNVKARQTKTQNEGVAILEDMIQEQHLLEHKVLLFLLKPGQIDRNISGLIANKLMAKYQRPVCVLTQTRDDEGRIFYQGSARGCDKIDIDDFKGLCALTNTTEYTKGHPNAFGMSIRWDNIDKFIKETDHLLYFMSNVAIYYVDYIFDETDINVESILDIASMEYLWGQEVSEALVAIKHLKVTPDMVTIYDKKSLTIKIQLPNNISIMLFNATETDCKNLQTKNTGYVELDIIGTCQRNEWMDNITPQIFITEYQITDSHKYFF